jgi:D-arginine dehydrogenase
MEPSRTMSTTIDADVIVLGAGMAGASIAWFLAPHARVLVLEREAFAGMHSTGRSAALFCETYGSAQVRALTRATRPFLDHPPAGFASHPILTPRGALVIGTREQSDHVLAQYEENRPLTRVELIDGDAARARVPVLRPDAAVIGMFEPGAADIDVNELHQGFLHGLKARGGGLRMGVDTAHLERSQGHWLVTDDSDTIYRAPVLVNAAGAWADEVARLAGVSPIGLQPKRRTAFLFDPPPGIDTAAWPFVTGAAEDFYFKPDAGLLLGSPANTDPVRPHDVQPEDFDIALGIDRIEQATTMTIHRPRRSWAGLRSFVADGDLVGGFDPHAEGFFWLAAQGGYGIQTSAAMGEACAHLVLRRALPSHLSDAGIGESMLAPRRPPTI